MQLTFKIKLLPTKQQAILLRRSMTAFNKACNFASAFAFEQKMFGKYDLQDALYAQVRADYALPSQMAVRVFAKVSHAYQTEITKAKQQERPLAKCRFKLDGAAVYDARLLTYGKDNTITIKTLEKRLTMAVNYYDETKLPFFKGEADLILAKGKFLLLQTLTIPETETISASEFLGKERVRQAQRASRSSWSFFQLRSFIEYKAKWSGVPVTLVDPRYTSQRCSVCGHIAKGNRKDQEHFCCLSCRHTENADFNACKNIKALADHNLFSYRTQSYRGVVNLPETSISESDSDAGSDVATLRGPIGVPASAASHTPCGCGH